MVVFSETKDQVRPVQIEEFEAALGLVFPDDYKTHLLQHNGGYCTPNIFKFNENGNETESCIDWFYAIYDGEYNNLKDVIQTLKVDEKRLPTHMLPIAHDPGGNEICISCGDSDYGHVYFWDHETEVNYNLSNDSDYSNLYLIADSFTEFLNGLDGDIRDL